MGSRSASPIPSVRDTSVAKPSSVQRRGTTTPSATGVILEADLFISSAPSAPAPSARPSGSVVVVFSFILAFAAVVFVLVEVVVFVIILDEQANLKLTEH